MFEQFNKLITEPFASREICAGQTLSIFLDGLDECQGEAAQREIVDLINAFVRQYPAAPLAWIVSSRPEPHLQVVFSPGNIESSCSKEYIPVDSEQACRDVECYLRTEFENIRHHYPYHISSTFEWPTETQFLKLASAASGLFVFAAVLVRFIKNPDLGDPVGQLDLVLAMLDKLNLTAMSENPLAALDMLYSQILSPIPSSMLGVTKRILGHVLLQLRDRKSYNFIHTCNLLSLRQHIAYGALQKLHSVVQVPSPESAVSIGLRFYHASFADYLLDPSRSRNFCINVEQTSNDIWWCYCRILHEAKTGTCLFPICLILAQDLPSLC